MVETCYWCRRVKVKCGAYHCAYEGIPDPLQVRVEKLEKQGEMMEDLQFSIENKVLTEQEIEKYVEGFRKRLHERNEKVRLQVKEIEQGYSSESMI